MSRSATTLEISWRRVPPVEAIMSESVDQKRRIGALAIFMIGN